MANVKPLYLNGGIPQESASADTLDQNARVAVAIGGSLIGTRRLINFVSGATASDNSGSERVDVTISASGGGISIGQALMLSRNLVTS